MMNGNIGLALRYALIAGLVRSCGDNVAIHPGSFLHNLEQMELGSNVSIHPMTNIDATGGVVIGSNVSIAHAVTILSTAHTFEQRSIPIKYQPLRMSRTVIEDDVWIGAKATVLAGVTVGKGAVIGTGAVVTRSVPPYSIAVGVPARVLAQRPNPEGDASAGVQR